MKAQWLPMIAVLIVGLALGALLVGRPATPVHDVRITSVPSTTTPASTTLAAASTTSTTVTSVTTTAARTVPSVRAVPTTTETTAVSVAATSTDAVTTTTTSVPDRSNVSVLVANAGDVSGIARAEAGRLTELGYPTPVIDNAIERLEQTTVYARAGHEAEALVLLTDAGLSADRLRPFPRLSISTRDTQADVILALGMDWQA